MLNDLSYIHKYDQNQTFCKYSAKESCNQSTVKAVIFCFIRIDESDLDLDEFFKAKK